MTVENVLNKSTQVQSMQLHKLLDINEDKKPNETKYEVEIVEFKYFEWNINQQMFNF